MSDLFYKEHQHAFECLIDSALKEDIGSADHSSLACLNTDLTGKAQLEMKQSGIVAGVQLASHIFKTYDPQLDINFYKKDGDVVQKGEVIYTIEGSSISILATERLALNCMQRMSGIATLTSQYVELIKHTSCKLLDTRKTTPNFRLAEKWAVRLGGGVNHRMGLYDMIMLKDNHIDFSGGVKEAIYKTKSYLSHHRLELPIIVETRNLEEVQACLCSGGVSRILLDNMPIDMLKHAVALIDKQILTEASGNLNLNTVKEVAETGVDYISVGSLTHSAKTIDMSLKATEF